MYIGRYLIFRCVSTSLGFGACNQAQTSSKGPLMFAQVLGGNPQTLGYRLRIYRAGYNVRNVKIEKMRSQGVYLDDENVKKDPSKRKKNVGILF